MTLTSSVSFTASRELDAGGRALINTVLAVHVPDAGRYVTGGCQGGDAFIGRWLHANRPDTEHVVIVPAARSRVDPWWETASRRNLTVVEMPAGSTYAHRNARLAAWGDSVFAFPAYPEDDPRSRRSGTWQTVRMSRRSGKLSMWRCVQPPYTGKEETAAARDGLARIVIDPNVRVRGHGTYAGFEDIQVGRNFGLSRMERAGGMLVPGQRVLAVETEDQIVTDAIVTEVDHERRLVYLLVDWRWFRDDPELTAAPGGGPAQARTTAPAGTLPYGE